MRLAGLTKSIQKSVFTRNVNIYMSPHNSLSSFVHTLNHEFIHAYHNVSGLWLNKGIGNQFRNYTEYSAYTYSLESGVKGASYGLSMYHYNGPLNIYNWPNYLILNP